MKDDGDAGKLNKAKDKEKDEAKEAFEKSQSRFAGPPREKKESEEGHLGRQKPETDDSTEPTGRERAMREKPAGTPASAAAVAEAPAAEAPAAAPVEAPTVPSPYLAEHTVVSGDNLSYIAKHYYGTADKYMKIDEANKDIIGSNPSLIRVGQVLKIPRLE
jgi:nucleoid-associated protein YgaU